MTVITMSRNELTRLRVLIDVADGRLSVADATGLIGVGRRQIYRLLQAFRADGADGLISRKRGGPSNRALGSVFREIRPVRYQPTGQKPTAARSFTGRQRTAPWWQILGTTGRMVRLLPSGDDHPRRGQYWSEGCRKL